MRRRKVFLAGVTRPACWDRGDPSEATRDLLGRPELGTTYLGNQVGSGRAELAWQLAGAKKVLHLTV